MVESLLMFSIEIVLVNIYLANDNNLILILLFKNIWQKKEVSFSESPSQKSFSEIKM